MIRFLDYNYDLLSAYSEVPKQEEVHVLIQNVMYSKSKDSSFGVHILCEDYKTKKVKYAFYYSYYKSKNAQKEIWTQLKKIEELPVKAFLKLWFPETKKVAKIEKIRF